MSNRALVTFAALVGIALSAIDVTIVGTALPTIIGSLGGLSLYSWVFAANLLAATISVPLYGKLADLYGRKPIFLFGVGAFLIGSMLAGTAQTMPQLIVFRAIQGLGTGAVFPITITITGDLWPIEQRARIQALFSSMWGVCGIMGPAIGALVVENLGWRWVFYVNVPFGITAITLMAMFLHEAQARRAEHQLSELDFRGAALLTAGLLALLVALLVGGQTRAWLAPPVLGPIVLSAGLLFWFWRSEKTATLPIVPPGLMLKPLMRIGWGVVALAGAMLIGLEVFIPLFVQGVLLGTAASTGIVLGTMSVTWPLGSILAGRLMLRTGHRTPPLLGGMALTTGAVALSVLVLGQPPLWAIVAVMSICGTGLGLINNTLIISIQNSVEWTQRGVATALITSARSVGSLLGASLLGTLFAAAMVPRIAELGIEASIGTGRGAANASALLDPAARAALPPAMLGALQQAVAESVHPVFIAMALLGIAAVALAWRLPPGGLVQQGAEARAPQRAGVGG